jgi:tetratricopeptide (TPR) repeat protein
MTAPPDPRIQRLLRQAERVAALNKRDAAEKLFRDLLAEAPDHPDVLVGLSRVVDDEDEQRALLERALALDPDHLLAQTGLDGDLLSFAELEQVKERQRQLEQRKAAKAEQERRQAITAAEAAVAAVAAEPEGGLRCNRCSKPIDPKTAQRTPVGYRCKACVRELEAGYYTATPATWVITLTICLALSALAVFLLSLIGFWFITLFAAPAAGGGLGRFAFRAGGRKRGRHLPMAAAIAAAIGVLLMFFLIPSWFVVLLYLGLGVSATYYALRA